MKNYFRLFITAAMLALVAACSTPSVVTKQGTTDNPVWPQLTAKVKQGEDPYGTWPNLKHIGLLESGMIKSQIYHLLDEPHFGEGISVREWDYTFNFRVNDQHHICQFKVLFDDKMRARSFFWLPILPEDGICPPQQEVVSPVAVVAAPAPAPAPAPAVKPQTPAPQPKMFTLGADAAFSFDGAELNNILPEGRAKLDRLIEQLKQYDQLQRLTIVAHTDRLGSVNYNIDLSGRRAATIKQYFINAGIPEDIIVTMGVGKSQPIKHCGSELKHAKLIECLADNRRVEILVN